MFCYNNQLFEQVFNEQLTINLQFEFYACELTLQTVSVNSCMET